MLWEWQSNWFFATSFLALTACFFCILMLLRFRTTEDYQRRYLRQLKERANHWLLEPENGGSWGRQLETMLMVVGGGRSWFELISFAFLSGMAFLLTLGFSLLLSENILLASVLAVIGLTLPYLFLYFRYVTITSRARKVFLDFLQGYVQAYLSSSKIASLAFKRMGERCPDEFRPIMAYITIKLTDGSGFVQVMRTFERIMDFSWATDFVQIVIGMQRGEINDGEKALNSLLVDLYHAKNTDQERETITKTVMIYVAGITLAIPYFISLNLGMLKSARHYYFYTPEGLHFLTLAVVVCFGCLFGAMLFAKKGERL
ncbi:hypothetical protein [Brevibacillus dissolubilis]|uniref:hypothetical protein n=1 Tax=Brevibacillus dissolubilis TaxID=1844116 RepID=UPI001115C7C0|nr:hypothetical protein [Brevibacillus dissolubilis]